MTDSLAREQRTRNISARDRCRYCGDNGYVVVQTRTDVVVRAIPVPGGKPELKETRSEVEEMGPCPFCERGFFEEFGDEEHQQKCPPVKAPWAASGGFWKGRAISGIAPLEDANPRFLSREENLVQARALLDRIKGSMKEMP